MAGGGNIAKMLKEVEHKDGPLLTIGEVAEFFERHPDTIRRWGERCGLPSLQMDLGKKSFVWCYTQTDLRVLEKFSRDINPKGGRPTKNKKEG